MTIVLGLWVHLGGGLLSTSVRDVLGDALWAMMMAWGVAVAVPRSPRRVRAGWALGICWAVELSQLYHSPAVDAWRRTTLGHLVLGSDFDPRDLVAYAAGIVAAILLEGAGKSLERP